MVFYTLLIKVIMISFLHSTFKPLRSDYVRSERVARRMDYRLDNNLHCELMNDHIYMPILDIYTNITYLLC